MSGPPLVVHVCGHATPIEPTVGPVAFEVLSDMKCAPCVWAGWDADAVDALVQAAALGWPALDGEPWQVGWAAVIRQRSVAAVDRQTAGAIGLALGDSRQADAEAFGHRGQVEREALLRQTSAAWWLGIGDWPDATRVSAALTHGDVASIRAANDRALGSLPAPGGGVNGVWFERNR